MLFRRSDHQGGDSDGWKMLGLLVSEGHYSKIITPNFFADLQIHSICRDQQRLTEMVTPRYLYCFTIKKGQCPSSLFLSNVNECVSTRESKGHAEGLNSKVV